MNQHWVIIYFELAAHGEVWWKPMPLLIISLDVVAVGQLIVSSHPQV